MAHVHPVPEDRSEPWVPVLRYLTVLLVGFAGGAEAQQLSEAERKEAASRWLDRGYAAFEAADYSTAAKNYSQSLEYWVTDMAAANLCNLYFYGNGVPRDFDKARELCEVAAGLDNANALTMLGEMYQSGTGLPQDRAKALDYYRKASALGHLHAQYSLGYVLLQTSPNEGITWLRRAADGGHEAARELLRAIEGAGRNQDSDN